MNEHSKRTAPTANHPWRARMNRIARTMREGDVVVYSSAYLRKEGRLTDDPAWTQQGVVLQLDEGWARVRWAGGQETTGMVDRLCRATLQPEEQAGRYVMVRPRVPGFTVMKK